MRYNRKVWFLLPMRCLLFLAAFTLCGLLTHKNLTEITNLWTILASILNIVTIIVLLIICKSHNTTYLKMTGFKKKTKGIFKGLLFIAAMLLIGMAGMYLAGWICYGEFPYLAPMMIAPVPKYIAIINVFLLPLTTTIAEDGLYLGYGINSFGLKWAAVLIPAFFYALQHSFIPVIFDIKFIIYRFLSFLPLTVWICLRYYKGTPVSYIMTGHCLLNIATAVQILITSFYPEAYITLINGNYTNL